MNKIKPKINAIIFSKDRASQLYLLLQSINKNAPDIFNLNVIYTYSNAEYELGYKQLNEMIQGSVNFVKEENFKQDVIGLMSLDYPYTTFFTDDDVIFQALSLDVIEKSLQDQEVFCFSTRLGINTTFCYTMSQPNKLVITSETDETIKFDWQKSYMDYGYPLSVDGHIFRTKEILKLTKPIGFSNPNTYESALQAYETFPRPMMESYKHSKLVGVPVNVVQNVFPNKQGEKFGITAKELNDKFLKFEYVDLETMDFSNVVGCHQEIEYKFLIHA